ncbi:MAG: hypothetical protein ACTSR0_00615, partial [Candidatus Asgardarchaeia archaeon]
GELYHAHSPTSQASGGSPLVGGGGHFGVDLSIVWDIITVDIPELKEKIKGIIEKEGWGK